MYTPGQSNCNNPCVRVCSLAPLYTITIGTKSMGVTGTTNDRTVYFDLFLTGYFIIFLHIPGTYTGTAFITTTAILSDSFFVFFWNESISPPVVR